MYHRCQTVVSPSEQRTSPHLKHSAFLPEHHGFLFRSFLLFLPEYHTAVRRSAAVHLRHRAQA